MVRHFSLPFLPVLALIVVAVVLVAVVDDAIVSVFLLFELLVSVFTLSYVSPRWYGFFPLPLWLVAALVVVVFVNVALVSVFAVDCGARSMCSLLCYHAYRLIVNQAHLVPFPFRSIHN